MHDCNIYLLFFAVEEGQSVSGMKNPQRIFFTSIVNIKRTAIVNRWDSNTYFFFLFSFFFSFFVPFIRKQKLVAVTSTNQ